MSLLIPCPHRRTECGLDRNDVGGIERDERNHALRNIEIIDRALKIFLFVLMQGLSLAIAFLWRMECRCNAAYASRRHTSRGTK